MQIAVLTNDPLRKELNEKALPDAVKITWLYNLEELLAENADVYIDLLFVKTPERIKKLLGVIPTPVFINSVTHTSAELGRSFIRINGWTGFLKRNIIEIAVASKDQEKAARSVLSVCRWPFQIVPDEPGMISARVIAMIVNEAYFALGDGVSTKTEIDIAMKSGTNYPYGPFEWSEMIGLYNIYELLLQLNRKDERYIIADAMKVECLKADG